MSFLNIKVTLVQILTELVGVGQPFNAIFGYQEPTPGKYPCLMVYKDNGKEPRMDSASNFLTMRFFIRICLKVKNSEESQNLELECLDAVLDKLREHADTLNNTCEKLDILALPSYRTDTSEFPIFGSVIIIEASKLKSII